MRDRIPLQRVASVYLRTSDLFLFKLPFPDRSLSAYITARLKLLTPLCAAAVPPFVDTRSILDPSFAATWCAKWRTKTKPM